MVLNAEDQAFLTNMTFQFEPRIHKAVWIGLQDRGEEAVFVWVNCKMLQEDVTYWQPHAPNNAVAQWDLIMSGQDCVGIVLPTEVGAENWLMSWDDIVCGGLRHYICETLALDFT